MTIGIIGLGIAGGAMYRGFKSVGAVVCGHDVNPDRSRDSLDATLAQEGVLLALPTPVDEKGRCDLSAIHTVLDYADQRQVAGSLVLRSTVPVGTTEALLQKHPRLRLGVSPELLRSHSADCDFLNPRMTLYGGRAAAPFFAAIDLVCPGSTHPKIELPPTEVEMVKLLLNGFASVKSVFASELAQLAQGLGADWSRIVAAARLDGRLGEGYLEATGPDHLPGFGGHCLPKDSRMLAQQLGKESLLHAVLQINERLRQSSAKTILIGPEDLKRSTRQLSRETSLLP